MITSGSRHWPAIWFLGAAAICFVIGLLGGLGSAFFWFLLAVVLDTVALVLFMRSRSPEEPRG